MLNWEALEHDRPDFWMIRAKVFGGWLVISECDALTQKSDGWGGYDAQSGHQFRQAMTFVPDPNHEWKLEQ